MVEFLFSKQREIEGIIWTFAHISKIRKISSDIILPPFSNSLSHRLLVLQSSHNQWEGRIPVPAEVKKVFMREFSGICHANEYQKIIKSVRKQWRSIEKKFFKGIQPLSTVPVAKTYRCYITFYGGGGSFGRKKEIYVRVNTLIPNDLRYANYTIAHEIIHLIMEPTARIKNLSPLARERLVDGIIERPPLRSLFTK